MIPPHTRTTIAWNCALALSTLTLASGTASAADLYAGTAQQASANFDITTGTDASGRIIVDADWNTSFVQTPPHGGSTPTGQHDFFYGAAGTSYNLTIGANADLFNVGAANDSSSQFLYTPGDLTSPTNANAFFLRMDGASATSHSLIANYGSIGTTFYNPMNVPKVGSASSVVYIQNTDFTNYGNIGYNDNSTGTNYLSTISLQMGPNSSFTNRGTVHSSNGIYEPTSSQAPIPNVLENNYGLIYTKLGSAMEGTGTINNFSTGELEDGTGGSYGIQMYQGATAANWGVINFYTEAVYMAQNTTVFDDWGGPLFPGSYMNVPVPGFSGYAPGCTLAFHGALGNAYDSVDPTTLANPGGGAGGSVGITAANAGSANILNLHSTVYTITNDTPGKVTPAGTQLLYLPIITGAIWASDLDNKPNTSTVNLDFEGITDTDRTSITTDITSSTGLYSYEPSYDNGVKTVTTTLNVGGVNYSLYNVRNVVLKARRTMNPVPYPATSYPVGVYSVAPSSPSTKNFYPAAQLANPVTLRLAGPSAPALGAGTTYVEAGWVLQLGAMTLTDGHVAGTQDDRRRNGAGNYPQTPPPGQTPPAQTVLSNCTAIYIDSGTATASGFNIDGSDPKSTLLSLPGTLVVDNQSIEQSDDGTQKAQSVTTTLPPLQGSGQFVQQGSGTVTLTGANTLSGTIFIPRGTLQFAPGATLPNVGGVVMDTNDTSYVWIQAILDLSAGTPTANVVNSKLGSGFVLPFLKVHEDQEVPAANNTSVGIIKLGANNLIIGNPAPGAAPANSYFMGHLTGAGALEVAGNTTLQWGGAIGSFNDYSGGTVIDPGALVQVSTFPRYQGSTVQPYYMFGTGSLTNDGTLTTLGGRPQVGINGNVPGGAQYVQANVDATDSGGNHVIYVNGNYTQGTGGNLVLNVNSNLLASGGTPTAAGIASDYLNVGGTLTLGTNASLTLNDVHPAALTQPATIVIAQAGTGTLGGANIFTSGSTGAPLYEGAIFQVGLNSAVIHYGTLSGYTGAITLTLFPTGFDSWASTDIGAVGTAGSASYANGAYTVSGSGADIWNSADAFQFVEQPLVGDGAVIARVSSVQNTNGWAKAGVMIRDSLALGAANAAILLSASNGVSFQWRASANGPTQYTNVYPQTAPNWVKLVRSGNNFTGYHSQDGVTWTVVGNATSVAVASAADAGLAVTSHDNTKLCTATFDNVNILPGAEWSASDIGAPGLAGFTSYSDGVLSVEAGGTNLWGTSDQFRFVYQLVSGDCDITALVADVSDTNPKAKAGLMIRETLASNSPHYFLFATPEEGIFLQSRADPAGSGSVYLKQDANLATPRWLRLQRSGTTLTTYTSTDGANWKAFTTITNLTLSANAYVGIALTGSNATTLGAAEFGSISVSP